MLGSLLWFTVSDSSGTLGELVRRTFCSSEGLAGLPCLPVSGSPTLGEDWFSDWDTGGLASTGGGYLETDFESSASR
jgi:hypothetical protein